MTADGKIQGSNSPSPVRAKGLLGDHPDDEEQSREFDGSTPTSKKGFLSLMAISPSPLKSVEALLLSSTSFKRLEAAKEEISEKTPSDPLSHSLRLKEGINLPIVGEVRWDVLKAYALAWLRNPKNLALLVWIIGVIISGALLFMVMVGMLNSALPRKKDRDAWFEVNNQIINGLFTLMCLYLHPMRCMHLYRLYRWEPRDIVVLRKVYCKDGLRKPHEWAHMLVVVLLLQMNCFSQYALCGLNWGYKRSERPAIGVAVCLSSAIGCAAAAGIYNVVSPLGRDYAEDKQIEAAVGLVDIETGVEPLKKYRLLERKVTFAARGKLVESPEWRGGLFDFKDDPGSSFLSTICCFCVFGWNMERLGFGNRFVHIVTFMLVCSAPFLVLNLAAVNIDNEVVRRVFGVGGIVLSVLGLMYGGYWRIKMRTTFNLPAQRWCCNQPNMTDCTQWMFCSVCALCQEVRTAQYYEVRDDKFYLRPPPPPALAREPPQVASLSPTSPIAALSESFVASSPQKSDAKEVELPKQSDHNEGHPMVAPELAKMEMNEEKLRS